MKNILFVAMMLLAGSLADAQDASTEGESTLSIPLIAFNQAQIIDVHVTIDGMSLNHYWSEVFDELFANADVDQSGSLDDNELRFLPSARAVRLALGTGFTPPVASLKSTAEITGESDIACTREAVGRYYRDHGVGCVQVGQGVLPHTAALTEAFIRTLDADRDGSLGTQELSTAETAFGKLDTNDDELISASELLPDRTYPGCAAATPLYFLQTVEPSELDLEHWTWNINVTETIRDESSTTALSQHRQPCELWSVSGGVPGSFRVLQQQIDNSKTANNESDFKWFVPLVDRDANGEASEDEISTWLQLQQKIAHGQLLISVYTGGGLFEALDQNHDGGLSIRELCSFGQTINEKKSSSHIMIIASQGYPDEIRKFYPTELPWFRSMDRNSDGDVSRREFTEVAKHFTEMDRNHDSLISASEAERLGQP